MKKQWFNDENLIRLCRLLVCLTFLGRAWQHLRWDAPVRAILWNQALLKPIITDMLGIPWQHWVGDLAVDAGIQTSIRVMGGIYLICAITAWLVTARRRWAQVILGLGSLLLFFLAFLYYFDQYKRLGQWAEYTLQWSVPLFLILAIRGRLRHPRTLFCLKLAVALTFIGHGMYAAGIYPMPGHFVTMLMNGLHLSENSARALLVGAGYMDFAVALMLFVPHAHRFAIAYTCFWGFATAAARLVAYYDALQWVAWLDGWLYQCLFRVVHGGIPLMLWWLTREETPQATLAQTPASGCPLPQAS